MNQEEWDNCNIGKDMFRTFFKADNIHARKRKLAAIAFCRRLLPCLEVEPLAEKAVIEAEVLADLYIHPPEKARQIEMDAAKLYRRLNIQYNNYFDALYQPLRFRPNDVARLSDDQLLMLGAMIGIINPNAGLPILLGYYDTASDTYHNYKLTYDYRGPLISRDICPRAPSTIKSASEFYPCDIPPEVLAWNDGMLTKMAKAIYDAHSFHEMPILADAFEDAGCDSPMILNHLRGPNDHVRGCWVLDLLMGVPL